MHEMAVIAFWTALAGLTMPAGAAVASVERIRPRWLEQELRHFVIAFGGGVLLSAVALVLVPEGVRHLDSASVALCFTAGGLAFFALDVFLSSRQQPAAQAAAMLADFVPEALALGALFSAKPALAPLLALLIALQNLPEGFNAFRELSASAAFGTRKILSLFTAAALLGPFFGLAGYFWLGNHPSVLAVIMLFSAGGILYLVFQDIAPQSRLARHWAPPLGAVLGFLTGILGQKLTGA
ncbi:MAG: divalent cation transporter [Burkholderiaceae bacterium]|nr:divalent cation transporter [Burkholderiaceae bacterium]